ncbi:hypothetical protein FCM35_KLT19512 [Carex littledalei]|uniref:Uncharacterized protein n=1 Tax=Carex littledalei TaxID=544730 RepID=A0A833VFM1_9POAL|nr:hypothetical protein FCM35_KLT19512 [Carex littledalei]
MSETRDRDEHNVQLDIIHGSPHGSSTMDSPNLTIWEADPMESDESSGHGRLNQNNPNAEAPEKELTLFALRLAILEQLASGLGTLAFIWATVVLLGGFSIVLSRQDFWFVTVILVIEGARIYSRSGEIEWQHQSTWTFANGPQGNAGLLRRVSAFFNPTSAIEGDQQVEGQMQASPGRFGSSSRTWNFREIPLLSFWGRVFLLKNIGEVLIWLQVSFALGSMALSLHQLARQNFGHPANTEIGNRDTALNLFYSLALANDLLFLMEKLYWSWKINQAKLLESVSRKCGFKSSKGTTDLLNRFFYNVYSACINESIFGALKKDLVSYAEKLLETAEPDKNIMGAQILLRFVNHDQFAFDTIRRVGTSAKTMERLVEMLSWKNKAEKEIRKLAAQVVSKISGKRKGSIHIAKIPGSLEAIASLLHTGNHDNESGHEEHEFNLLGLLILRNLSSEHQNCEKIRKSPGLISKIIEFTDTNPNLPIIESTGTSPNLLLDEHPVDSQIKLVRRALQVVLLLASSKGDTGNALRQQISRKVFIVGYIRKILKHGKTHMLIQKISIQILTYLAMDEEATERIASTGGVINLLLKIFFEPGVSEETSVCDEAGEALSMLTIKSQKSCNMILQECNVLVQLADMVSEKLQGPYASRILRNVCVYATPCNDSCLDEAIKKVFPIVLERTIAEKGKLLEVSVGLLVALCKLMKHTRFHEELAQVKIDHAMIVKRLIDILEEYKYPDIKVPRLRRYVIELSIWMMNASDDHLELFKKFDMEKMLESVAETTTELENFHLFSGSVGLSQHSFTVADLLGKASALLQTASSTSVRDNN